ncbi:hypothetical protein IL54_1100 [Sphingobium sp. ba1]|nr:hypothetical protein IL54_1100 [Sphingobium sp. ba1]
MGERAGKATSYRRNAIGYRFATIM